MGKNGYISVSVHNKLNLLHRLLCITFKPNPNNLPFVDHINRVKTDNRLENLRWVSVHDNNINRQRRGCIHINKYINKTNNKEYIYYKVAWVLPNEKRKSKSFKTKEEGQIFLNSLNLQNY